MASRRHPYALYALFFASGAAGLVYQVVWSRLLNEVFGVTAYAVTAVLATYLGGLALGGWILGPAADRSRDALRLYGLLEIGIGAAALAGTWVVRALDPLDAWAASRLAPDSPALLAFRCVLASAVVLPPTFLMGGTLAATAKAAVDRIGMLGRKLALLYALNTAGAVAGSLAAGFALIRAVGVHPTLWIAVGTNLLVGFGALALAAARRRAAASVPAEGEDGSAAAPPAAPDRPHAGAWLLAAMALSGFASLSLEVIWTRMLVIVVGTSTYAFVTMLAAFLVGIAAGSFLARGLVGRLSNPRRAFGLIEVAIAASSLATVPLLRAGSSGAVGWVDGLEQGWPALTAARFAVAFLVMIVPTTLIGTTFPLAATIWARRLDTLGSRIGRLYGANTLGNIAGALAGGFLVLPAFGMQRGVAIVTIPSIAAAALALLPLEDAWWRPRVLLRAAPVSAVLWTVAVLLWRPGPLPETGGGPEDPVRYYREGLVSTVKVFQRARDGRQLVMAVDGVVIGQSGTGVDRKQQVLAHLPFLLEPDGAVRDVLTIGLGTGILDGEVARHPGVESVESVELSPSVIEAAGLFERQNGGVLHNPAVHVVNDDGVSHLRRSARTYDAVIADGKSRSGHAGNAVFYSQDFYRMALSHLADGGVMLQWVPLDVTPEDLRTIVRTFLSVFPHAYLWFGSDSSFLVGANRPLALDLDHVEAALGRPEAADLRRHGWDGSIEVASLLVADGPALARWVGRDEEVSSLERPVLEFYSPASMAAPPSGRIAENVAALAALRRQPLGDVSFRGGDLARVADASRAVATLLDGLAAIAGDASRGVALVEAAVSEAPGHGVVRQIAAEAVFGVGRALDTAGRGGDAIALYRRAAGIWPDLTEAYVNLGRILAAAGRRDEAAASLARALETNPESGAAHRMLGHLLVEAGDPPDAIPHLRETLRIAPDLPDAHEDLGLALLATGRLDDGLADLREALRLAPDWPVALDRVALVLATHPDPARRDLDQALRLASRAERLTEGKDPMTLEVEAAAHAAAGDFDDAIAAERRVLDLAAARGDSRLAAEAQGVIERYARHEPLAVDLPAAPEPPGSPPGAADRPL